MAVTISDIARQANVSKSVVSKVINQRPDVAPGTRELVLSTIENMGYVPSMQARNLSLGHSNNVAIVVPSDNYAYMRLVFAVYRVLSAQGYAVGFHVTDHNREKERHIFQSIKANSLLGLLYLVDPDGSTDTEAALRSLRIPTVILGDNCGYAGFDTVYCSEKDMAVSLAAMVKADHHESVLCLFLPEHKEYQKRRNAALHAALPHAGLSAGGNLYAAEVTAEEGARLTREALLRGPVTAVCSLSNVLSAGVLRTLALTKEQHTPPTSLYTLGDMSIYSPLGMDCHSVFLPIETMADEAARVLARRLAEPDSERMLSKLVPWTSEAGSAEEQESRTHCGMSAFLTV